MQQETPTPEDIQTPEVPPTEPEVKADGAEGTPAPSDGDSENPEPPAYVPNYSFKIHGEEKEFDAWAKELVKDKESEEMYREIMTKVHGIDYIKQDREELRAQLEEISGVKEEYSNLTQSLDELSHYINTGNLQTFFDKVGISKQQLLNYYDQLVQYEQMSPEQRMAYDNSLRAQADNYRLMQENQSLTVAQQEALHAQRMNELELYISRPDISGVAKDFDARMGQQGSFKQQVINYGVAQQALGKDVGVDEAINYIINLIGGVSASPQNPSAMPGTIPTPHAQPPQPMAVEKKPVIPVVPSSGKSPVKPGIKSIDDLRKAREAL